jgi:hypothetical protein
MNADTCLVLLTPDQFGYEKGAENLLEAENLLDSGSLI